MRLQRYRSWMLTIAFGSLTASGCALAEATWTTHVFRIAATRADGLREIGSAIALSGDRLVTNCHVIAGATRIEIASDSGRAPLSAVADQGDSYRDLCFLRAPGLDATPIPTIELGETRVGLEVVAAGYPGGDFALGNGRIVGLHVCECDGGKVIQTSAPFDKGASGGGLFDARGRLVGILAFKSRGGGNFHFALPVGWLRHIADMPIADRAIRNESFWSSPGKESGYFLAACSLGERKDWHSLARLAQEWCEREPGNPEAWMAFGRAHRGMGQTDAALADFQHALMLDSTHAEAQWALQELELETGRSLTQPDRL